MKSLLTLKFALMLPLLMAPYVAAQEAGGDDFRPLFNGQDLSGWVRVNTAPSTWTVEDGLLVCSGKPIGELRTTRMYQNFILELEWRHMKPAGNAGVFVWADSITAKGVPFHRSIEVQVLENAYGNTQSHTTHGDIFPIHGATMTPVNGRGGSRAFPTEFRSNPSPQWNHYRIECREGNISLAVNGKVVTQGRDCRPSKGFICLESEGGVVHYRNIRLQELPDTPIPADEVAMDDQNYRCLYLGIDLQGWQASSHDWQPSDWVLAYRGAGAGTLTTEEHFQDLAVIADFRMRDDVAPPAISLRGATIQLNPTQPAVAAALAPAGNWNRIVAKLAADQLSVLLNGQIISAGESITCDPSGPIALRADGPVDFANLYVQALPQTSGEAPPAATGSSSR